MHGFQSIHHLSSAKKNASIDNFPTGDSPCLRLALKKIYNRPRLLLNVVGIYLLLSADPREQDAHAPNLDAMTCQKLLATFPRAKVY